MKTFKITEEDYLKGMRKASRELEIEMHGKQISMRGAKMHKSKKEYSRKGKNKFKYAE